MATIKSELSKSYELCEARIQCIIDWVTELAKEYPNIALPNIRYAVDIIVRRIREEWKEGEISENDYELITTCRARAIAIALEIAQKNPELMNNKRFKDILNNLYKLLD